MPNTTASHTRTHIPHLVPSFDSTQYIYLKDGFSSLCEHYQSENYPAFTTLPARAVFCFLSVLLFFLHELLGFHLGIGTRLCIPRNTLYEDALWSPRTWGKQQLPRVPPGSISVVCRIPPSCSLLPQHKGNLSLKSVKPP